MEPEASSLETPPLPPEQPLDEILPPADIDVIPPPEHEAEDVEEISKLPDPPDETDPIDEVLPPDEPLPPVEEPPTPPVEDVLPETPVEPEVVEPEVKIGRPGWVDQNVWNKLSDEKKLKLCHGANMDDLLDG